MTTQPSQEQAVQAVAVESLAVPDLRVTSIMSEEQLEELVSSIRQQGILQPLQVLRVEGVLWVVDGYNRLMAARELQLPAVPCIVRDGSPTDLALHNLVVNRQRGKSNPAEEARLVRHLREEAGLPVEEIARRTGISTSWARKLHDLYDLPPEVLELVANGKLGVSHALELRRLPNVAEQVQVATHASEWRYTVEQVKVAVESALRPGQPAEPGGVTFAPTGRPQRIPILCTVCHADITDTPSYSWACEGCRPLIAEFGEAWRAREAPPPVEPPAGAPPPPPQDARYLH